MEAPKIYDDPRLAPEMASFRLLVLAFVRDYIGLLGCSPSYGEISAKLHSNRTRVKKAVLSLEKDGLLIRTPGTRGLKLPSMRDAAIRELREMGWVVDEDVHEAHLPVTKRALLTTPALDYLPDQSPDRGPGRAGETDGAEEGPQVRKAAR